MNLPNPPCQLSLLEETGVPGENLRLSAEHWLYSFHMRTGFESTFRWTLLGIELGTLGAKGEWSEHYTIEARCISQNKDNESERTLATIIGTTDFTDIISRRRICWFVRSLQYSWRNQVSPNLRRLKYHEEYSKEASYYSILLLIVVFWVWYSCCCEVGTLWRPQWGSTKT